MGIVTVVFGTSHWKSITEVKHWGENRGRGDPILTHNELNLTFRVPSHGAKLHQNRVRTATVGEVTDRQKDRQTDRQTPRKSDFIICPMLCSKQWDR